MSRSRKKNPYIVVEKRDARSCNRALRHDKFRQVSPGGEYKKSTVGGYNVIKYNPLTRAENYWFNHSFLQRQYTLNEWRQEWRKETIQK